MNFRLFQVNSNPHMFSYLTRPSNYIKENLYAYNFFQCPGSVIFFYYQAYDKISSVKHLPCIFSLVSLLQRLLVISARCATRSTAFCPLVLCVCDDSHRNDSVLFQLMWKKLNKDLASHLYIAVLKVLVLEKII